MATNEQPEDRWETIKQIWRDEKFVYQVLGGLVLVGIGVWIGSRWFDGDTGYVSNLYTELLSIGVTVFVLDLLARRRDERREEARLKRDLIMRMGSQVNDTAVSAANELRARRWLYDGSLKRARLFGANLEGVDLRNANLEAVDLRNANLENARLRSANLQKSVLWSACLQRSSLGGANLEGADLHHANLQGASLGYVSLYEADLLGADLQEANLRNANLQEARLWFVNLRKARLLDADLQGASLSGANLQGAGFWSANLQDADLQRADLSDAKFSEYTVLPDMTIWTPDTDLTRFTDPNHSNFWRPKPGSVWWYPAEDSD